VVTRASEYEKTRCPSTGSKLSHVRGVFPFSKPVFRAAINDIPDRDRPDCECQHNNPTRNDQRGDRPAAILACSFVAYSARDAMNFPGSSLSAFRSPVLSIAAANHFFDLARRTSAIIDQDFLAGTQVAFARFRMTALAVEIEAKRLKPRTSRQSEILSSGVPPLRTTPLANGFGELAPSFNGASWFAKTLPLQPDACPKVQASAFLPSDATHLAR
jgi:hypothetical protein